MSYESTARVFLDVNGRPILFDSFGLAPVTKSMTFAGAVANDPGDYDGSGNPATLFTVTGNVAVRLLAYCTTLLAGATATLEVGTTKSTASLIAQTTATDIDADEIWHDTSPDSNVEAISVVAERAIINGGDIIQTAGTANITAGVIEYACFWRPLTEGSSVVAA